MHAFITYSHVPYFISKSNIILFDQLQESRKRYLNHSIRILKPKLRVIAWRLRHHVQLPEKLNCLWFNPNNASIMHDIRQRIINQCLQFPFRTIKSIFYSSAIYKFFIEITPIDSRFIFNNAFCECFLVHVFMLELSHLWDDEMCAFFLMSFSKSFIRLCFQSWFIRLLNVAILASLGW